MFQERQLIQTQRPAQNVDRRCWTDQRTMSGRKQVLSGQILGRLDHFSDRLRLKEDKFRVWTTAYINYPLELRAHIKSTIFIVGISNFKIGHRWYSTSKSSIPVPQFTSQLAHWILRSLAVDHLHSRLTIPMVRFVVKWNIGPKTARTEKQSLELKLVMYLTHWWTGRCVNSYQMLSVHGHLMQDVCLSQVLQGAKEN